MPASVMPESSSITPLFSLDVRARDCNVTGTNELTPDTCAALQIRTIGRKQEVPYDGSM